MRFTITVCPASQIRKTCKRTKATHMLTILEFGRRVFLPPSINRTNYLRLTFDDLTDPNALDAPKPGHIDTLLGYGRTLPDGANLLIHCYAGVSRSTAAAFTLIAQEFGLDRLDEAAAHLLSVTPHAEPNSLMMQYADDALGADGRLAAAAKAIRDKNRSAHTAADLAQKIAEDFARDIQ